MKRLPIVLIALIVIVTALYVLRPRVDRHTIDAASAPPMVHRLAWVFNPPSRAIAPIGFAPQPSGRLVLIAVAHHGVERAYGTVYALDRNTGQLMWTFDADGTLSPTPVALSGVSPLIVADGPGGGCRLFALRDADGTVRWELATGDRVTESPGTSGLLNRTAVPAGDDGVYLVDERTGKALWQFKAGHVKTSPLRDGQRLFLASGESHKFPASELIALNEETGGVEWRVPLPGRPSGGDMWVGEGVVIVPLTAGLACFDSGSGGRKWLLPEAGPPALEPRLLKLNGTIGTQLIAFIGTSDGFVRAVDVGNGHVLWSAKVASPVVGSPVQAGEYVFAATRDGQLFQLNQRTGAAVGQFDATTILGGNATVLAAASGPHVILITEFETPDGLSIRVVCLEHVEWFTPH